MGPEFESLMSPEEVARWCGLSRRAVYRAIERGELCASRLCHRLRVRPSDVEAWIELTHVVAITRPPSAAVRHGANSGLRKLLEEEP